MTPNATDRMTALVKTTPEPGMALESVPVPEPGPGEVRIRVESVGIDGGAEALIYDWHESKRHYADALPQLFGHEFAGTVDAIGPDVDGVATGERVAVEPIVGCGHCRCCRSGSFAICPDRRILGLDTELDGALAEYAVVPRETIYPIGSLSADEGVFLELLGLAVRGIERSGFEPGDSVAITGPGPVGIGALVAAVAGGASSITVAGTDADRGDRLPLARQLGATRTVVTDDVEDGLEEDVDVFIEAAGHPDAFSLAASSTRRGGEIVQIGIFHGAETVPVDLTRLVRRGVSITTVYGRRDSSWRRAIAIAGDTDLSPALGPSYPLEDYEDAFEATRQREGIKITLRP
ncbi:zinc-dependent alcohol dehydrogenase [Natrinema salsiterrestre]|uniref:Alcohol dehydrogenase catalytic domain-containing protein n=1 Tax=Natrinema salsiterrestre TaxID=2950540 RepID=A0A9Q4Q091_9EURY|nr:alcohol dehydrogenase catalytic domain-containing protein [Natrinema salsiterrestre]MDF9746190.1 alcohol dehydrogenase catalytic domain-containing protein [Natrinema salsiterrestre]